MSIIEQVKASNWWKLLTDKDLEEAWKRIWVDPKTVKKITLNEKLLWDVKLRFHSWELRIWKWK